MAFVNMFDGMSVRGQDGRLNETSQTLLPLLAGWADADDFATICIRREGLLSTRPAIRTAVFTVANPLNDRFGRLLRYVYVGDMMINEELVRTGYAQASTYPLDVTYQDRLDSAERFARENNAGLWAIAVVVPRQPPAVPTPAPVAPEAPAPVTPTAVPPPPAPTGSGLVIISVNKRDEYVDIRNDSGGPMDLGGWTLRSERGSQDCALGGVMGAGEVLRIWAMSGSPGYVCGFGSNIWNNSENDDAILINPQGQEAYRYDS